MTNSFGILIGALLLTVTFTAAASLGIKEATAHIPNHRPVIVAPDNNQAFAFEAGQGIAASIPVSARDSDGDFVSIVNTPPAGWCILRVC